MSVANLILQYIRTLIWPLVVVSAIVAFKDQARGLLKRLKSIGGAGFNAEFTEDAKNTLETAQAVLEERGGKDAAGENQEGDDSGLAPEKTYGVLRHMAERFPSASVVASWKLVEFKMQEALRTDTVDPAQRPMSTRLMIALLADRGLDPLVTSIADNLDQLAEQASDNFGRIAPDAALNFVNSAHLLVRLLDDYVQGR